MPSPDRENVIPFSAASASDLEALTTQARAALVALNLFEQETLAARRERVLAYGRAILAIRGVITSAIAFNRYLVEHHLDYQTSVYRSDAMWLARHWAALITLLNQCPHATPAHIRQWARQQGLACAMNPRQSSSSPRRRPTTPRRRAPTAPAAPAAPTRPLIRRRINETPAAAAAARRILDNGEAYPEIEAATGLSNTVLRAAVAREEGRREALADPVIDPTTLAPSAQQRLAAAIRQTQRRLEVEHAARLAQIDDEVRRRVVSSNEEYVAWLRGREAEAQRNEELYRRLINNRRPPLTNDEFMLLHLCVRGDASEEKRHQAGVLLNTKRLILTGQE